MMKTRILTPKNFQFLSKQGGPPHLSVNPNF